MELAALGLKVTGVTDVDRAASSLDGLAKSSERAERSQEELAGESQKSGRAIKGVGDESVRSSRGVDGLAAAARRAGGVLAAALGVRALTTYADTWSDISSRIQVSLGPTEDAASVMARLSDIARMTYSNLELTGESFAQNSVTLSALNKTTKQQLDYTEALNNALVVSGAKADRAQLVQNSLSRAMAEGTLRGEELNSVLNSGSRIAEALADELGVNITQLRGLAKEGKITGDVIFSALVGNMEALAEEAESMPATIGDAFTILRNSALQLVGVYDQTNGLSESLATTLISVADNLGTVARIMIAAAAGFVTYQVAVNGVSAALTAARVAQLLFNSAAMANPYVLVATAVVTATTALWAFRDATIEVGEGQATLADYARAAWDEVTGLARGFGTFLSGLWPQIQGGAESAWDEVAGRFDSMVEGMLSRAKTMANALISIFVGIGGTVAATATAWVDTFVGAFDRTIAFAKAFGADMKSVLSGELGFSAMRAEMAREIEVPLLQLPGKIAAAWQDAANTDWVGQAGAAVGGFAQGIVDSAQAAHALNMELNALNEEWGDIFGPGSEAGGGLIKDLDGATDSTNTLANNLSAIERAAIVWRMSADEVKIYDLKVQGATAEQLEFAQAMLDTVAGFEAQKKAQEDMIANQAKINADALSIAESLRTEEEAILASYERRRQIILDSTSITGLAQSEILQKLEEERNESLAEINAGYWDRWLAAAEDNLTNFEELSGNVIENFSRGFGSAFESIVFDSESLGDAINGMAEGMARSVVGALGEMAAQWLIYRAVQSATNKSAQASAAGAMSLNASAMSIAAGINAYASAAAIPVTGFLAAPAASATAIAATAPMAAAVGSLATSALAGYQQGGYTGGGGVGDIAGVVHGQEFVFDAAATRRIGVDNLESMRSGKSSSGLTINIHNAPPGTRAQERTGPTGEQILDVWLEDFNRDGRTAQAVFRRTGTGPQGR